MTDWRAKQMNGTALGWSVLEYDDPSAKQCVRYVASEMSKDDAHRIARLPKLEATVGKLLDELRRMLLWHDAVRREMPILPSPYYIDATRAAVAEAAGPVDCGICSGPDCEGCSKETGT